MTPLQKAQERARRELLEISGCYGPYDVIHRCSAMHCDYCGVCDRMTDIDSLIAITRKEAFEEAIDWGQSQLCSNHISGDEAREHFNDATRRFIMHLQALRDEKV